MVEVAHAADDILSRLVVKRTQMTISELLPLLDFKDLASFYQLNKACKAVLTPSDPKCLRFDVLLGKRADACDLEEGWQEKLSQLTQPQAEPTFGKVMVASLDMIMPTTPRLHERKGLQYKFAGNTHIRRNAELKTKELMGYAGSNGSMHSNNPSYFGKV